MRWIKLLACILCLASMLSGTALAGENQIQDELELSGAQTLYDSLSEELKTELNTLGIDSIDPEALLKLDFTDWLGLIWSNLSDRLLTPIKIFASIAAILMINAIFAAFRETLHEESAAAKTISSVSILAAFAVIAMPVTDMVSDCIETIRQCGSFMLSFVPVFGSVLTLSGKVGTAGTYSSFLLFAVEMITQFITAMLLPLISVYLAFSVCGAVGDTVNLSGMAETVKKAVMWAIGVLLTVFVGFLSIQSIVANASDTVGVRTAKYVIGSSVPIVGGAMSEAFNTLSGCMGLLRSTVGVFGVVICMLLFLPIVLDTVTLMLSLNLASFFGDMLGDTGAVKLTKSAGSAMSILLGILLFVLMMCILSTTVILVIGSGGG